MHISVEEKNNMSVITIEDKEVDAANSAELKEELHNAIRPGTNVLLDLSKLEFLDSSGLGVLLSCMRYLTSHNGTFQICSVTKPVQAILELVRFHRVVDTYNNRNEAFRAFE